jgi:hypothetical protein
MIDIFTTLAGYTFCSFVIWLAIDRSFLSRTSDLANWFYLVGVTLVVACITLSPFYITWVYPPMTDIHGGARQAYLYAFYASLPLIIVAALCYWKQFGSKKWAQI